MEKSARNTEEINDEGRVTDVACLVIVTGHLNNFIKNLQIAVVSKCIACF
jgi:hypothetical protein